MPKRSFHEKLQPHVGGLVRVVNKDSAVDGLSMGKIGLLLSAGPAPRWVVEDVAVVKLLIDGSARIFLVYPHDLEFIGADDA
jgi:hypothetical protein